MGLIGSAISAIGSFIGGVATKVGSLVGGMAKGVIGVVAKIPGIGDLIKVAEAISFIAKVIHTIVDLLGIKSEEDPEILGAKAQQSEKKIEDFDNDAEAYIRYLKEKVELDKQKFNELTPEEKMGCKAIGLALETKAVEAKLGGVEITPEALGILAKVHIADGKQINVEELLCVIKGLRDAGITNMNDVVDYLEGKGNSDRIKTGEVLRQVLGEGALDKISEYKDAVRKFEEE